MKQNEISELPFLDNSRYENLFNVYFGGERYSYNLYNRIWFPEDMDPIYFSNYTVESSEMPWTAISQKLYGTIKLWWLICTVNKIINPVLFPESGTVLKVLKKEYVNDVLRTFNE